MQFRTFRLIAEAFEWRRLCISDGFAVDGPFMSPTGRWAIAWYRAR